jgi:hypothetical protein
MPIEFSEVKIAATFLINERKEVCLARLPSANYSCRNQLHFQFRRLRAELTRIPIEQAKAHRCSTNLGGPLRHLCTDRAFERLESPGCTTLDIT